LDWLYGKEGILISDAILTVGISTAISFFLHHKIFSSSCTFQIAKRKFLPLQRIEAADVQHRRFVNLFVILAHLYLMSFI
jgi:hypothetical protein